MIDNLEARHSGETDVNLFEVIYSARAMRRFKLDPVPEALLTRILDAAIQAPSAGNSQNWSFVVVRASDTRRKLGEIYAKASEIAEAMYAARGKPAHLTEGQFNQMMTSGAHLWAHMGEAPVILIPCLRKPVVPPVEALSLEMQDRHEAEIAYVERIRGASIYPAIQNLILACRALGLGTTITTNHLRCEDEVRTLLRIPDDFDSFAMMPIGWPVNPFGLLSRRPLREVVHADSWENSWPA
ncbi:nitroreductase family protein [Acidisphaera sp. S103]|uniref:nitroreductase family protein n=1 Tax=Acidisphaera sp. S103 TaxID=1747223 RepID=UPI00131E7B91|nr:nitroreductase family protein [Acidisphaera sp. S103]